MREFFAEDLFDQWGVTPTSTKGKAKEPLVYEDAIISANGCYDANGNLIEISKHKRGRQTSPGAFPIGNYSLTTKSNPSKTVDEAYFINYANDGHWGHFLTETLARVHHLDGDSMNVISTSGLGVISKVYPQHKYSFFTTPVRCKKLMLPVPTMVNCYSVFPEHIDTCRKLGDYYGRDTTTFDRVYLSRTKLSRGNRWTEGEPELEKLLEESGWTIIHMQDHSVKEQIGILENSRIISGCIGSAFHNLMMTRKNPGKVIYLTCNEFDTNPNYALHDFILGNESVYLDCQTVSNPSARIKRITNPTKVFEYLNNL